MGMKTTGQLIPEAVAATEKTRRDTWVSETKKQMKTAPGLIQI
jgi:hypothetical protein